MISQVPGVKSGVPAVVIVFFAIYIHIGLTANIVVQQRQELSISECAAKVGECDESKGRPVCGTDGQTYPTRCHLLRVQCSGHQVSIKYRGPCKACSEAREYAIKHRTNNPLEFIPRCKRDGTYASIQCLGTNGCWCSDNTGKPIDDTEVRTGKPKCRIYNNKGNIRRSPPRNMAGQGRAVIGSGAGGGGGATGAAGSNGQRIRKACTQNDRATFNQDLLKIFQAEYTRSPQYQQEIMNSLAQNRKTASGGATMFTPPPIDENTILQWKFLNLDVNNNQVLDRKEYRELKKLVIRAVKPRRCGRAFGKFCDVDSDERLSRMEWNSCLSKDGMNRHLINMGQKYNITKIRKKNNQKHTTNIHTIYASGSGSSSNNNMHQQHTIQDNNSNNHQQHHLYYQNNNNNNNNINHQQHNNNNNNNNNKHSFHHPDSYHHHQAQHHNEHDPHQIHSSSSNNNNDSNAAALDDDDNHNNNNNNSHQFEDDTYEDIDDEDEEEEEEERIGLSLPIDDVLKASRSDGAQTEMENESERSCFAERKTALEELTRNSQLYVPECTADNRYQKIQCYPSTSYCWCVNEDTGKNIHGTSVKDKRPQCESIAPVRVMKGCPDERKLVFLKDLKEFLKTKIIAGTNAGANTTKWNSEDERIATLSFVILDKNKNKIWERKESKIFRELVSSSKTLRKCGRKMPKYCDVNSDKRITLTEWLNCLQYDKPDVVASQQDDISMNVSSSSSRPPKLNGTNPLETYLKD